MKIRLLFVLLFIVFTTNAQHPAYYMFGEEQFKGIDIYNVIQDNDHNYLFATGQGLIKHNGYTYENLDCPEMKGSSVFGFTKDSKGIIYCLNLHHQIFRIKDEKMELYYEIPPKSQSSDISIIVDPDDNLIIQSRVITFITPNKSDIRIVTSDPTKRIGTPSGIVLLPNGSAIASVPTTYLLYIENGTVTFLGSAFSGLPTEHKINKGLFWIVIGKRTIGIDSETSKAYEFDLKTKKVKYIKQLETGLAKQFLRLYATDDKLWFNSQANGAYVLDYELNPLFNGASIYEDHFISHVFTDHEGNLLLSTFDEGVIVIPSNSVSGIALPNREKITQLEPSKDGLLIGSNRGDIHQYSTERVLSIFNSNKFKNSVESLYYWEARNAVIRNQESTIQIIDLETKKSISYPSGSLKDVHFISSESVLLAFNSKLVRWDIDLKSGKLKKESNYFNARTYSVSYDSTNQLTFVGSSSGLRIIDKNKKEELVQLNGKAVYATQIIFENGQTIVGTRKNGTLIYSGRKIVRKIPFSESPIQLILHKKKLFILTRNGLYLGNFDGSTFTKLNQSTGLELKNVVDFAITNEILYVTNSSKIQSIKLDQLYNSNEAIPIRFTNILVNGSKTSKFHFDEDQSNFLFEFSVSTLRYRENIKYAYKLKGYSNKWHKLDYSDNSVEFSALPPGEYTFIVKAINGTAESKPIRYSFTIEAPYYQKWWFYVLTFLVSGLIIGLIFTYRIRRIRTKNIERLEKQKIQTDLLETELKALRSQMNPHFIFNSLNSIQDLILKEDTDASYDYIVLFADLVRSALNYSNKDFIPIEKELEFLDVYLSLEKLRFKEDFNYSITFNGSEDIDVPSMLIQPFIENALLHGLLHKSGKKHLDIVFTYDETLICTIEDNGIGRKKSAVISERQGGEHESFALEAINKRLRIFNERQGEEIGKYTIEDLHPEQEETGTKVVIQLPFKRQY